MVTSDPQNASRALLCEGQAELDVIYSLLEGKVRPRGTQFVRGVGLVDFKGRDQLLDGGVIGSHLKVPGRTHLGVILDAETSLDRTFQSLYGFLRDDLTQTNLNSMPPDGAVLQTTRGVRIGFWIFPDNTNQGMLETFLGQLAEQSQSACWQHCCGFVDRAQNLGATFKDTHRDKARIYAWLAVQDPPGQDLRIATTRSRLRQNTALELSLIRWFRELFELQTADQP